MATRKIIDPNLRMNNDTGFGTNAESYGGRFINKDGSFNLRKEGMPYLRRYSIFYNMLTQPLWRLALRHPRLLPPHQPGICHRSIC